MILFTDEATGQWPVLYASKKNKKGGEQVKKIIFYIDKYGVAHTSKQACVEANQNR